LGSDFFVQVDCTSIYYYKYPIIIRSQYYRIERPFRNLRGRFFLGNSTQRSSVKPALATQSPLRSGDPRARSRPNPTPRTHSNSTHPPINSAGPGSTVAISPHHHPACACVASQGTARAPRRVSYLPVAFREPKRSPLRAWRCLSLGNPRARRLFVLCLCG
jgi:hypothetical protein